MCVLMCPSQTSLQRSILSCTIFVTNLRGHTTNFCNVLFSVEESTRTWIPRGKDLITVHLSVSHQSCQTLWHLWTAAHPLGSSCPRDSPGQNAGGGDCLLPGGSCCRIKPWVSCIASRLLTILATVHLEGWLTHKFSSLWVRMRGWITNYIQFHKYQRHTCAHQTVYPLKSDSLSLWADPCSVVTCSNLSGCICGEWKPRIWPMVPPQAPYPLYPQSNCGILFWWWLSYPITFCLCTSAHPMFFIKNRLSHILCIWILPFHLATCKVLNQYVEYNSRLGLFSDLHSC